MNFSISSHDGVCRYAEGEKSEKAPFFRESKTDQMGWIFRFLHTTAYVDTPREKNRKRRPFQRFLQELGDLDGISRCAFSDLIAAAPDLQTTLIGEILADAANEDEILIGGIEGHGINLIAKIIY